MLFINKWLTSKNFSFSFAFKMSYLTEELRITREEILRFKLLSFVLSFEDMESIRN